MTQKLRIAIIGAGRIGYVHAGSVNDTPNLELIYVVDPFEESAKKVIADFGGKYSADPVAVINSGEIDAVIIGSPTPTHIPSYANQSTLVFTFSARSHLIWISRKLMRFAILPALQR